MYEKAIGWVQVVFGVLAVIGSIDTVDGYGLVGGVLFTVGGIVILKLKNERV